MPMTLEELKVLLKRSIEIHPSLAAELVKMPRAEPERVATAHMYYMVYHVTPIDAFWIQAFQPTGIQNYLVDLNA